MNLQEVARESEKTIKVREKLKKQLESIKKDITQASLKKKTDEIHSWIAKHAMQRKVLKHKNIPLFDENQNSAKNSLAIKMLSKKLSKDFFPRSHGYYS